MPPMSAVALQGAPLPSPRDGMGQGRRIIPRSHPRAGGAPLQVPGCLCPLPTQVRQLLEENVVFAVAFCCTMCLCLSGVQYTWEKDEEVHSRVFSQDLLIAQLVFARSQG